LRFGCQPPRHVQALAQVQQENGLAFCDDLLLEWTDGMFETTVFSDESRCVLGDDKTWVWDRAGEDNESASVQTVKFPRALMFFAVIGIGYKSRLLVIPGSIDAERYMENCRNLNFIEEMDGKHGQYQWAFQQDGAPAHTARKTMDWLEEVCNVLTGWPANSPDLSPIEMCWAVLKNVVAVLNPQTLEELATALETAWDGILPETIDKLCRSFRTRLVMCRDTEGKSISSDLWMSCERECIPEFNSEHQGCDRQWTPEEDTKIIEMHLLIGSDWRKMAPTFDGRTAQQIKNRWHYRVKKREERKIGDLEAQLAARRKARERYRESAIPRMNTWELFVCSFPIGDECS
jgi:hypothetical protein